VILSDLAPPLAMKTHRQVLLIVKLILTVISMVLVCLGTATNTGGETSDDKDNAERMMNFGWNALKLEGPGTSDTGVFVGFNQICAYDGNAGGQCVEWVDDGYDGAKDFCDNDQLRTATEAYWSMTIQSGGFGANKGADFTDTICACFHMQFVVPVFLFLAFTLMLVDTILMSIRLCCTDNKFLFITSMVLSSIGALLSICAVAAYGVGCNLIDNPGAFFAWSTSLSPSVAAVAPLIAARVLTLEEEWGTGFYLTVVGCTLEAVCAILSCFIGSCKDKCCKYTAQTSSSSPPTRDAAQPAVGVPTQQAQAQAAPPQGAKFDPQTGQPIPKFDPTTGVQNW